MRVSTKAKILLRSKNEKYPSVHDYAKQFKSIAQFYNPYWLQEWAAKTRLWRGRTIRELLVHQKQSLWDLFEYLIFVDNPAIPYDSSSHLLYTIDVCEEILKREQPKKVILQNQKDSFYKLFEMVCHKKGIEVKSLKVTKKKPFSRQLSHSKLLVRAYFSLHTFLRQVISLTKSAQPIKEQIVLLSNERFCRGGDEQNQFWGTIVQELQRRKQPYSIIEFDMPWSPRSLGRMARRQIFSQHEYIGQYYSRRARREMKEIMRLSEETWRRLQSSRAFQTSLEYKGVNLHDFIAPRFKYVLSAASFLVADAVSLGRAIAEERPRVVAMEHEFSLYGYGVLVASKETKTRTVALQFESVNPRTSVHRHIKEKRQKKEDPLWRPLPDVKCASGPYAKRVLIENCNYPANIIRVTGQPRYEALLRCQKERDKDVLTQLHLDPKKKTIIYATKFRKEEEGIWKELQRIVEADEELQLIFKLAPSTKRHQLKGINPARRVRITSQPIEDLLAACDLLISIRSTVIIEAMVVGVPVMLVDFYKTAQFPFEELGAVYLTENLRKLAEGVHRCLYDKKTIKNLLRGNRDFLKKYLNGPDGKTTKCVVDIITELLKDKSVLRN